MDFEQELQETVLEREQLEVTLREYEIRSCFGQVLLLLTSW